mgnify:CR=1 FL=1
MDSAPAGRYLWRSQGHSYGGAALLFHWAVAFLFLAQIPLGYLTQVTESRPALQFQLYQWHKSLGFLVLALSALRLAWLWFDGRPEEAARASPLEKLMASVARITLYAATLLVPLTGWAIASASPLHIPSYAFNLVLVPPLPMAVSDAAEAFWSNLHAILAYCAAALAAIHIAAALDHHFRRKDSTLTRMLRTSAGGNPTKDGSPPMQR